MARCKARTTTILCLASVHKTQMKIHASPFVDPRTRCKAQTTTAFSALLEYINHRTRRFFRSRTRSGARVTYRRTNCLQRKCLRGRMRYSEEDTGPGHTIPTHAWGRSRLNNGWVYAKRFSARTMSPLLHGFAANHFSNLCNAILVCVCMCACL